VFLKIFYFKALWLFALGRGNVDDWLKASIAAAVGGVLTVAAAVATGWLSFVSKNEELRVHLVEIAIGILRADPKDDVTPARAWAIDVIEKNSGVPFNAEDRAALLHKPINAIDAGLGLVRDVKVIEDHLSMPPKGQH
jgi:hypothetical protein